MDLKSGKGVQVVSAGPEQSFALNEQALKKILQQYDVRDRSVVVVSVAGAFRKGKSFLLDFFLRYLHYKYNLNGDKWLDAEEEPLSGFSWRGGSERDTHTRYLRQRGGSTVKEDATMFALSTMLSSVQIYNLSQNLAENDLQYLQRFHNDAHPVNWQIQQSAVIASTEDAALHLRLHFQLPALHGYCIRDRE